MKRTTRTGLGRPATSPRSAALRPGPVLLALALPALAGCGGNQDVLHPESSSQQAIVELWWVMLGFAALGFASILALLFLGWVRRKRTGLPGGGGDRRETGVVVLLGVVVPTVLLVALFLYADVFVMRSTAAPGAGSTAMTIHVTGRQWFWEVRYPGTDAITANEIHIPVRTRVQIVGTTDDVIHSFWVPELNRKVDLVPGSANRILLEADRPGTYRGQCSEFCGVQHAHMAVLVVAQSRARFRAWLANMSRPARRPTTALQRTGEQVFLSEACSGCHRIRGTSARGDAAPDLTHLASRRTLAALTIPNEPDVLRSWIADPQRLKPGAKMPALPLSREQLRALVAYLDSLR